jgi:hypothetical protein
MFMKKCILIALLAGVLGSVCLADEKTPDPFADTSVLVEAFMVRISTDALAEVGVSSIGQSPEGISILKILACLADPENGEVFSGAKVNSVQGRGAESKQTKKFYVKREKQTRTRDGKIATSEVYDGYSAGKSFTASPYLISSDEINIYFVYHENFLEIGEDKAAPPDTYSYDLESKAKAKTGVPVVAGAWQDEESVVFLILTATIQE